MKKTISVLLAAVLLCGMLPAASAADGARLYNVYADGMIFQQNAQAIFAGDAAPGEQIEAVLKQPDGSVAARGMSSADATGKFTVSFDAPAGSFEAYSVELFENGRLFRTLSDVVFGEVWLSAGQSNMSYAYRDAEDFVPPAENATAQKNRIRLFWCPEMVKYKGDVNKSPALPQNEIPECCWFNANDPRCEGFSAVSYFFALDLAKELDVPLGIVAIPLGGSSILSWLPREAVESSKAITDRAKANNTYFKLEDWDEDAANDFQTMTALYNKKTYPVHNFRYAGMIWYQGESDIMMDYSAEEYAEAFDLMQDSYSALFDHNGKLPIIWTQLASYYYSDNESNTLRNIDFADMQRERPESRALVTAYDYPSTYQGPGPIHPQTKRPIGERMSFSAQRLVYGKPGDCTLPTVAAYEAANGGISVTFRDVGDGLACDGALRGFAIAGADGVYVRANAEITGKDTVFIHDEAVPEPVSASYAFAITADRANLYATENGAKTLPVSPFILDRSARRVSYQNNAWMECEEAQSWHSLNRTTYNAFYDTWKATNADVNVTPQAAYDGEGGLSVSGNGIFSIQPLMNVMPERDIYTFSDLNTDWTRYGKLRFAVRNDGEREVTLILNVITSLAFGCTPAVEGSDAPFVKIPSDGAWHIVTFDLTTLYPCAHKLGLSFGNARLKNVTGVKLVFKGTNARLSVDDFRFLPAEKDASRSAAEAFSDFLLWILSGFTRILDQLRSLISIVC